MLAFLQLIKMLMKITFDEEEAALTGTRPQHGPSVKSGEGIKFQKTITINRPPGEVYDFWRHFENLPQCMRHLESVVQNDPTTSHWKIRATGKTLVEWDAQIIEDRANELISWQSLPGADVDNAGSVWFREATGNRGTVVKVVLKYVPHGGKFVARIAKIFGKDAAAVIEDDLYRFKSLLETGEMPTVDGQPHGIR